MRIRQVAIAAPALEPVVEDLRAVLGLEVCFQDPGVEVFGLRNALLPVGDAFLEVLAPIRPRTAVGRFLERRSGPAVYMVIVQTDDLAADRERLDKLGVRVVWEAALPDIATIHLHPRDVGAAIVSLDGARPADSWRWAGPLWREHVRTACVQGILGVEVEAAEPAALAARWSQVLGRPIQRSRDGSLAIPLDGSAIGFTLAPRGQSDGVSALELASPEHGRAATLASARARGLATRDEELLLGGTWLRLR
ncbi:MAG TPA: VOC family protein [Myxococcota bacterium]|nr:VOC family protein [Myxococcota bacterium]